MFGSTSGSDSHSGLIQLKETASQTIIASENLEYTSNGQPDYFDHMFSSPGVKYTVTLEYNASQNIFRGKDGLTSTTTDCNGVTVTFASTDSTNGSSVSGGQIPRILFSC